MHVDLPLEEMSIADKLDTMETLWNSLCETEVSVLSPDWHNEVLEERKEESFIAWEQSKKEILRIINDH